MCEAFELRCPTKLSRFNSFKWIRNPEFDTRFLKLPALLKESRTRSRSRKKPDKNIKNVFLWKFRPEILSEDSPYLNGTLTSIFLKSTLRNFSICGTNKGILIQKLTVADLIRMSLLYFGHWPEASHTSAVNFNLNSKKRADGRVLLE